MSNNDANGWDFYSYTYIVEPAYYEQMMITDNREVMITLQLLGAVLSDDTELYSYSDAKLVLSPYDRHIYAIGHCNGYILCPELYQTPVAGQTSRRRPLAELTPAEHAHLKAGLVLNHSTWVTPELKAKLLPYITHMQLTWCHDMPVAGVNKVRGRLNYRTLVSYLVERGLVGVRYTDHEYRDDCRDILWIKDFPLSCRRSVEGLGWNESDRPMLEHLHRLAGLSEPVQIRRYNENF
jgi:hypothetical protein